MNILDFIMGKRITAEVKKKILPLMESKDETNWYIAYNLLKSIDGINEDSAQYWMFQQFKKIFQENNLVFTYGLEVNKFCRENFKSNKHKPINVYDSLFISRDLYKGKPFQGITEAKRIGEAVYVNKNKYTWRIEK